jgi:CheY-like chemotaxis protein
VVDTGVGIDSEFLPFVFERFSQADGSTTKPHKGLGLGLAIARHLVHLHGGKIWVDSAGTGRGATFVVSLPCRHVVHRHRPPSALAAWTESPARATAGSFDPAALKGVSVLLVDDDKEARDTLRAVLEAAGASVADADSARAALHSLHASWPDVLLSDIAMPGEDGYELISRVTALARQRRVPLRSIALTAFARESDRALALGAGFDAHLSKPVGVDALVEAVRAVLKAHSAQPAS